MAAAHAALGRADPAAAARLHPADTPRVARALEVVRSTGRPLAAGRSRSGGIGDRVTLTPLSVCPTARPCSSDATLRRGGVVIGWLGGRGDRPPGWNLRQVASSHTPGDPARTCGCSRMPAVLAGTVGSALAVTQTLSDGDPEVATPVVGATRWLEGPAGDLADPSVGSFSFQSGSSACRVEPVDELGRTDPSEAGFRALAQDAYDSLLHMKPDTPITHSMDTGHPAYTPDWDNDGTYGEAEDFDLDVDAEPDVARFRYPCTGLDGSVTFERADGTCGPDVGLGVGADALETGLVREVRIVDARGFVLDATIWIPAMPWCSRVARPLCSTTASAPTTCGQASPPSCSTTGSPAARTTTTGMPWPWLVPVTWS